MTTEDLLSPPPAPGFPGESPPNWLEQDDRLRAYWEEHKPPEEIAALLGRTVAAVMTRAARLGLPRRAAPGRKRGYKRSESETRERSVRIKARKARAAAYVVEDEPPASVDVRVRVCLMCLQKFESEGRHNRICPSCKGSADYMTGSSTPDFVFSVSK